MEFLRFFRVLRRRWRLIAAVALLGVVGGYVSATVAEEADPLPVEITRYSATHTLVVDENLPEDALSNYPAGTVAMANSGPGTAGSQFFIVYRTTTLPASYTVWGTVETGLDIVAEVAAAGTIDGSTDGAPLQSVMIQQATAEPVA